LRVQWSSEEQQIQSDQGVERKNMNVLECVKKSLETECRFRKMHCRHNNGGPGVWMYAVTNDFGDCPVWVHYDDCNTAVKDWDWLTTTELLSDDWECR